MRHSALAPALVLITPFASTTIALQASTSSPCASQCGNNLGSTDGSDMACSNADFKSTDVGMVYQSCISCQVQSKYVDPITNQPDLHWAICQYLDFYLRLAYDQLTDGHSAQTTYGTLLVGVCLGFQITPMSSALRALRGTFTISFQGSMSNVTKYSLRCSRKRL